MSYLTQHFKGKYRIVPELSPESHDVPASEDANAKLYNICNDNYGYKLFLEDEDIVNKEVKEDENNENQTEYTE